MPPRFAYWTIIFGGQPTAFRSATREELLPTFKRIQSKHADAELRYFARGKLWYSDEEAHAALMRERFEKRQPAGRHLEGERRDRKWRPGGQHKDPRDRFKIPRDVKRARFAQRSRLKNRPFDAGRDQTGRGPSENRAAPRRPRARGGVPRPPKKDDE